MPKTLQEAVQDTVAYFDVIDMPVTPVMVWRSLLAEGANMEFRLNDVIACLAEFRRDGVLAGRYGYYMLPGHEDMAQERLYRHSLSQAKWKIVRKGLPLLSFVPFVRALAGSGSLALDNTKTSSDLDLFVVAQGGRIWTARLGMLFVTQLLGRRRKYFNFSAPDMFCVNHYIADDSMLVDADVRNVYTAVQYTHHVPLYGREVMRSFLNKNQSWISEFVASPVVPDASHEYEYTPGLLAVFLKQFIEGFLLEPLGQYVEDFARYVQLKVIASHDARSRRGRVVCNDAELAFHPDTKVPYVVSQFLARKTS